MKSRESRQDMVTLCARRSRGRGTLSVLRRTHWQCILTNRSLRVPLRTHNTSYTYPYILGHQSLCSIRVSTNSRSTHTCTTDRPYHGRPLYSHYSKLTVCERRCMPKTLCRLSLGLGHQVSNAQTRIHHKEVRVFVIKYRTIHN